MKKNCSNPDCYNHDTTIPRFCEECLNIVINTLTMDDMYEMFLEGDRNFELALREGDNYFLLTPGGRKSIVKARKKWFSIVNSIMREKWKKEN